LLETLERISSPAWSFLVEYPWLLAVVGIATDGAGMP
jgi:hypothetical protein